MTVIVYIDRSHGAGRGIPYHFGRYSPFSHASVPIPTAFLPPSERHANAHRRATLRRIEPRQRRATHHRIQAPAGAHAARRARSAAFSGNPGLIRKRLAMQHNSGLRQRTRHISKSRGRSRGAGRSVCLSVYDVDSPSNALNSVPSQWLLELAEKARQAGCRGVPPDGLPSVGVAPEFSSGTVLGLLKCHAYFAGLP